MFKLYYYLKPKRLLFLLLAFMAVRLSQAQTYCVPTHSYNSCGNSVFIGGVQLNTLDYQSGTAQCNNNFPYSQSPESTTLIPGYSYQLTLTAGGGNQQGWGVFIDFNQDGDFTDANEFLGQGWVTNGSTPLVKTINVPCDALGGTTRMRVRTELSLVPGAGMSCGNTNTGWGNTVDFNIKINAPASPSADFYFPTSIYTNQPLRLVNSNNPAAFYLGHEWDFEANGSIEKRSVDFDTVFTQPGTYRFRLASTNCLGTSSITKVVNVLAPSSTPVADFIFNGNDTNYYNVGDVVDISFFDVSTQGPTAWDWTITPDAMGGAPWIFLNGTDYNTRNPQIQFFDTGTYEVCLTAKNSIGAGAPTCKPGFIKIVYGKASSTVANLCGTVISSTAPSGILLDDGGVNGNYGDNIYCTYLIEPCGAKEIKLTFSDLNLLNGDYLRVFDGIDYNGIPKHTGLGFTGTVLPDEIICTSGYAFVEMVTDPTGNASGFRMSWEADIPFVTPPVADFRPLDTLYMCNGFVQPDFNNVSTGVRNQYEWIFDYQTTANYPPGTADDYTENPVFIYNMGKTYTVRLVVTNCFGSDTMFKDIVVTDPTTSPVGDFDADKRVGLTGEVIKFSNQVAYGTCSWEWSFSPTTFRFVNGTDRFSANPEVIFLSRGAYDVSLTVQNDYGSHVKLKTEFIEINEYCFPVVQTLTPDLGISGVKFANIDNQSPAATRSYTDYSADHVADVIAGGTYNITIERQSAANFITRKVWIDYNKDGIFDDPAERVVFDSNSKTMAHSSNIQIRDIDNIELGFTKMRIATNSSTEYTSNCGLNSFGEFEDYGIIISRDTVRPVITLKGDTLEIVQINSVYTDSSAIAIDNIEGNISAYMDIDNQVNTSQTGIYLVRYNVSDKSGNAAKEVRRKVSVVLDNTAPQINLNGNAVIFHQVGVPFVDPGFTALDQPGNVNLNSRVTEVSNLDVNVLGSYTIVYEVKDNFGLTAQVVREIYVTDTVRPVINAVGGNPYFVQGKKQFIDPTTVTENYDASISYNTSGSVNVFVKGPYQVTYTAVDASGNQAIPVVRNYIVGDTIAPDFTNVFGLEEILVAVKNYSFIEPLVLAMDDFDGSVQVNRSGSFNIDSVGSYDITYTAEDAEGNIATFVRTIKVVDTEKPTITGTDLEWKRFKAYVYTTGLSTLDNYDAPAILVPVIQVIQSNVDPNEPGIYMETYQVTDRSGNKSDFFTRVVRVVDDPTSVKAVDGLNVNVYPNPNKGAFYISSEQFDQSNVSVKLYNLTGAEVNVEVSFETSTQAKVQTHGIAAGTYFLVVQQNGALMTQKIIIQ